MPELPLLLSRDWKERYETFYKTGRAFFAWLNGRKRFHMLSAAQSARSISHLAKLLVRAEDAGELAGVE